MMKKVLGLDLGTNSIGWALIENDFDKKAGRILNNGVRVIPMDKGKMDKFGTGQSISQTADRTGYRGTRRLYQRDNLRRERLHRVLNVLSFLPKHYAESIDFEKHLGQFKKEQEIKLNYKPNPNGKDQFIFQTSFNEMVKQFKAKQPELFYTKKNEVETKIPYDWTIYYLRKKALTEKIEKEELAWVLLNFNQKRGYYQLRGENEILQDKNKTIERFDEEVKQVKNISEGKYEIILESGITYFEESKYQITHLNDLREVVIETSERINKKTKEIEINKTIKVEFINSFLVENINDTGEIDGKGLKSWNVTLDNGIEFIKKKGEKNNLTWKGKLKSILLSYNISTGKRYISAPEETNWTLSKKKTEQDIKQSNKTVGEYIYDTLLQNPQQKINGKLVKTIERKFYKEELLQILKTQIQHHPELQNKNLYQKCVEELYPRNEAHQNNILNKSEDEMFRYLFMDDIIFYQRPLKSKKSTISTCPYERRTFFKKNENGGNEKVTQGLKVISKSNPYFIEFRLWQFIHNLKIYKVVEEKDIDVTQQLLKTENDFTHLYDFLNDKKEVEQKHLISYFIDKKTIDKKEKNAYRWNYVEDKSYPINPTRNHIVNRLKKVESIDVNSFLTKEIEQKLWHIIYSVTDKNQFEAALKTFARKYQLDESSFVNAFKKHPPYSSDYGAYSEKAIKKLLPLMRRGSFWTENDISKEVKQRISEIYERIKHLKADKITDDKLNEAMVLVSDDAVPKQFIKSFLKHQLDNPLTGLNTYQACYAVYERHSEVSEITQWKSPKDIDSYLNNFKQHSLRNPIVEQVVLETLRTVRDIWNYHLEQDSDFTFDEIHLELGRDMKNSADKRKRISERQTQNENTNNRIKLLLEEMQNEGARSFSPSHQEILKIYEEGISQNPEVKYDAVKEDDIVKIRKNAKPNGNDVKKYKLWLEQGYVSPYTGEIISLNDLFSTKYQIEHIIPKSRYFDDSLSNKVICESAINPNPYKDNQTGYEFIKNMGGIEVPEISTGSKKVHLFTLDQYENHCNKYFKKNRTKLKNLLSEDIPEGFINRQLNDSRYISKLVKGLLSNIVREEDEKEATSKNLIPVSGVITSKLKQDWGLNEQWNKIIQPRFERLNELTNSKEYGYLDYQKDNEGKPIGKQFFRLVAPEGVSKKRIDHRHHTLDAIVIACCTRDHINYITSLETQRKNHKLVNKLCNLKKIKRKNDGKEVDVFHSYKKPWESFTIDTLKTLETTTVSFKKNTRVITKTNNKTWQWVKDEQGNLKKNLVVQTKGGNRAIRKPLHKETVYGKVKIKQKKKGLASLSNYLTNPELICKKSIREKVKALNKIYDADKKKIAKHLKENPIKINENVVSKIEVWEWTKNATASRIKLSDKFTRKQLESVTDTGIQTILENHIKNYIDNKNKERFDLAFNPEGLEELNNNIVQLNNGKKHQPIYAVRIYEEGSRFGVSKNKSNLNKTKKYVEAARGTNLFFAIYWNNEKQQREYETIPLNDVIEWQKARAKNKALNEPMIPIDYSKGQFLFSLSPNDLVYVPTEEEQSHPSLVDFENLSKEQTYRVYKMVSSTGKECHFIPSCVSSLIKKYDTKTKIGEFGSLNKSEKTINEETIKSICWKLEVNRIGKIKKVIK